MNFKKFVDLIVSTGGKKLSWQETEVFGDYEIIIKYSARKIKDAIH